MTHACRLNFPERGVIDQKHVITALGRSARKLSMLLNLTVLSEVLTALGIHLSTREENKNFFDVLKERESEINAKIKAKCDMDLDWQRRDDKVISVIGLWRAGNINSDAPTLEALKAWHIKTLLTFKEVFTPEIRHVRA